MSHELRTPLNAIIGFSEVMAAQTLGPLDHPQYHEYTQHIHSRSEEHTSELQSLMRISYADFCLKTKITQSNVQATKTSYIKDTTTSLHSNLVHQLQHVF